MLNNISNFYKNLLIKIYNKIIMLLYHINIKMIMINI